MCPSAGERARAMARASRGGTPPSSTQRSKPPIPCRSNGIGAVQGAAMTETVTVREVGPRDGLQIARSVMPTGAKVRWIAALADAGVREIEIGSFVPPKLIPQMADTAEIAAAVSQMPGVVMTALVPNLKGAQLAYAAG